MAYGKPPSKGKKSAPKPAPKKAPPRKSGVCSHCGGRMVGGVCQKCGY